jgi:hypothetical protein
MRCFIYFVTVFLQYVMFLKTVWIKKYGKQPFGLMTSLIRNLCLTEPLLDAILRKSVAEIAQPVEQGTENPRVPSSTLGLGTT